MSNSIFIDTNIFIRYITQDNIQQAKKAKRILEMAQGGELELVTSDTVIAEVIWVLSSQKLYAYDRKNIRLHVRNILNINNLHVYKKSRLLRALDIYAQTHLDYIDCHVIASVEHTNISGVASFDKDYDKLGLISRVEP